MWSAVLGQLELMLTELATGHSQSVRGDTRNFLVSTSVDKSQSTPAEVDSWEGRR